MKFIINYNVLWKEKLIDEMGRKFRLLTDSVKALDTALDIMPER